MASSPRKNASAYNARFQKLRTIGTGSYGRAVLVRDKKSNLDVVSKEIRVDSEKMLDVALSEADNLRRATGHENILELHDVFRIGRDQVNIITEYLPHGDLQQLIKARALDQRRFEEADILSVARQLVSALSHLHGKGMLHRDVKPANIFVSDMDGLKIKLGDFGISKIMPFTSPNVNERRCCTPVGTPMYVAPEICLGRPYGPKVDCWGLGLCLHELATLKPAFEASNMERLMSKIKMGSCCTTSIVPSCYTKGLKRLVNSLLEVNMEKRMSLAEARAFLCSEPSREQLSLPSSFPSLETALSGGTRRGHQRTRSLDMNKLSRAAQAQPPSPSTRGTKWIMPSDTTRSIAPPHHLPDSLPKSHSAPSSPALTRRRMQQQQQIPSSSHLKSLLAKLPPSTLQTTSSPARAQPPLQQQAPKPQSHKIVNPYLATAEKSRGKIDDAVRTRLRESFSWRNSLQPPSSSSSRLRH